MDFYSQLPRKIIKISGEDRKKFLQNLITCDIGELSEKHPLYGAFLTAQGRIKSTFFIFEKQDDIFLDLPESKIEEMLKYLLRMKLRNKVECLRSDFKIFVALTEKNQPEMLIVAAKDPRMQRLGWRGIFQEKMPAGNPPDDQKPYLDFQAMHGVLDDTLILSLDKTIYPSEVNMDLLNAISWKKGCYPGQEVTARFYHRNLTKRRPVHLHALSPNDFTTVKDKLFPDDRIILESGEAVGRLVAENPDGTLLALLHKKYWQEKEIALSDEIPMKIELPKDFSAHYV